MYPTQLPIAEVTEIISIIESGQVVAKKQNLVYDLWELSGYAASVTVGAPGTAATAGARSAVGGQTSGEFDPLATLKKVRDAGADSPGLAARAINIDWSKLLTWALGEVLKYVTTGGL